MKVAFVSHSSVLKYHQQKLQILKRNYNIDIYLITPPYWYEAGVKTYLYDKNKEINYIKGKTIILKKRMFHFYLNALSIIKKIQPDIIHIEEEPFTYPCYQFLRAGKKYNARTIFFTWENIYRKHNIIYSFWENYCIKNIDFVISGNTEGVSVLKKKNYKKDIVVIPQYGVNIEDFFEKNISLPKKEYKVAFMGRICEEKGIDTLVKAIKDIKNVKLILAGSGNREYINELLKDIDKSKIEIRGFIDREKIPEFLKEIDILVLPSKTTKNWKEQFGRVLIEAFAGKVLVIGSNSGAIPEVVGDAGLIFKEGDHIDLKNKIIEVINNNDLFSQLIQKGYLRVKEKFTNEKIANEIYNVYKKLI